MKNIGISYKITSYNPTKNYPAHTVYALNKGNNSGKPLDNPCPNCFAITPEDPNQKETIYWCLYIIWQSKIAYRQLIGSVIPFIRKRDLGQLLNSLLVKFAANPNHLQKTVTTAQATKKAIAAFEAKAAKLKHLQQQFLLSSLQ